MTVKPRSDQNFDDIANKFERNIYGTTKGRLRHELLLHHIQEQIDMTQKPLRILDAGGGTGVMSQAMLALGHKVTLSDVSAESLTMAKAKFADNQDIQCVHADIQSLQAHKQYDVVICHAVLEWLAQPLSVLTRLVDLVAAGGYLSLSFFNKDAFRFGNLLYGNFDYVEQGMQKRNQVRLNPQQPLAPKAVIEALQSLPVEIVFKAGIRCFHDYLIERDVREHSYEQLKKMEMRYGTQEPYMWLGKYFHLVVKRV